MLTALLSDLHPPPQVQLPAAPDPAQTLVYNPTTMLRTGPPCPIILLILIIITILLLKTTPEGGGYLARFGSK